MSRPRPWARHLAFLLASLLGAPSFARTWIVRADGSGDAPTIQAGVDSALTGDDVLVGLGTYDWASQGPGPAQYGPTMIEVRSGILLHSESGAAVTVLDAQEQGRVLVCRNCAGIEGFTITGGRTLVDGGYGGLGGGIFLFGGEPSVSHNIVHDNFAERAGGGIGSHGFRIDPNASATLRWNSILWNAAGYRTGGIEIVGGTAVIENNTVVGNRGGGIALIQSDAIVARNIVAESAASIDGLVGGFALFCLTFEGEPVQTACNITWDNAGGDTICGADGGGNLVADPRFCASDPGGTGVRLLRPDSPALAPNNSCGVPIGASPEGCALTATEPFAGPVLALAVTPSPARGTAGIAWVLPAGVRTMRLAVYDARGRWVRTLAEGRIAGPGSLTWDGLDAAGARLAAGLYVVRLETDRGVLARKMPWLH